MEIDITSFFENAEPWKFSHSIAEGGPSAGSDTWRTALSEAAEAPLLKTPEALDALRGWARSSGGWEKDEIDAWSADECNALFIQLVSIVTVQDIVENEKRLDIPMSVEVVAAAKRASESKQERLL
jgi:hypothetical protein